MKDFTTAGDAPETGDHRTFVYLADSSVDRARPRHPDASSSRADLRRPDELLAIIGGIACIVNTRSACVT
jgi:hypothetical protein